MAAPKPPHPKQAQIKSRLLSFDQAPGDFPDRGGKLEPVPRTRARDDDLPMNRMMIENEMLIRCVGVKADCS